MAVQYRPLDWWAITTALRFGGGASIEVGGLAIMYGASATSHIRIPMNKIGVGRVKLPKFTLGVVNMGGFVRTFDDINIGDVNLDYVLRNPHIRNGAYIESAIPGTRFPDLHWRLFGSGIRIFGTELFLDHYGEVGAGIGGVDLGRGVVNIDVSYIGGEGYDGWYMRFKYQF